MVDVRHLKAWWNNSSSHSCCTSSPRSQNVMDQESSHIFFWASLVYCVLFMSLLWDMAGYMMLVSLDEGRWTLMTFYFIYQV